MKRRILLIALLLLAVTNIFAEKYWYGKETRQNKNCTVHIEEYISHKSPVLKERVDGKYLQKIADGTIEAAPIDSGEMSSTSIFFGNGTFYSIDFVWDSEFKEGMVSVAYYINSNSNETISMKEFDNYNSALKEYKKQCDKFLKKLKSE